MLIFKQFIIDELEVGERNHEVPPVRLWPVLKTIRHERFVHVHEICAWDLETEHSEIADLVC